MELQSPRAPDRKVEHRSEVDGLRAVAVLAVLVGHCIKSVPGLENSIGAQVGARGVDLFFVLSGFCLSYPILGARGGVTLPRMFPFLRRRLGRIAPPYYLAVALFGILAFTGFGLPLWPLQTPAVQRQLGELGLDFAFLTSGFPMHNSDFWTLGLEMRWYVLFPLVLAAFVRVKPLFVVIAIGAYAFYNSPYGIADAGTLPSFMLGIVAADLTLRGVAHRQYAWALALVAMVAAVWSQTGESGVDHGDFVWALFAFLSVIAVTGNTFLRRAFSHPLWIAVGVASYSIYLVHHPILNFFAKAGVPPVGAMALALASGFAFYRFVERPLTRRDVRKKIETALEFRFVTKRFAHERVLSEIAPVRNS